MDKNLRIHMVVGAVVFAVVVGSFGYWLGNSVNGLADSRLSSGGSGVSSGSYNSPSSGGGGGGTSCDPNKNYDIESPFVTDGVDTYASDLASAWQDADSTASTDLSSSLPAKVNGPSTLGSVAENIKNHITATSTGSYYLDVTGARQALNQYLKGKSGMISSAVDGKLSLFTSPADKFKSRVSTKGNSITIPSLYHGYAYGNGWLNSGTGFGFSSSNYYAGGDGSTLLNNDGIGISLSGSFRFSQDGGNVINLSGVGEKCDPAHPHLNWSMNGTFKPSSAVTLGFQVNDSVFSDKIITWVARLLGTTPDRLTPIKNQLRDTVKRQFYAFSINDAVGIGPQWKKGYGFAISGSFN